ncbi:MAG: M15 family metallopeptidase [Thermodesulfobacteriota bacterium]
MPEFGTRSRVNLATVHPDLQGLLNEVIKRYDCAVICGHRTEAEQERAFHEGRSKVSWPESWHNQSPSLAVDVIPYPVDWQDMRRFYHFGGYVRSVADRLGVKIRWGGDWDGDFSFKDQNFHDLPHFELVNDGR